MQVIRRGCCESWAPRKGSAMQLVHDAAEVATRSQNVPLTDLHAQYLSIRHEIDEAIAAVIADSAFIRGPFVEAFEEQFARAMGARYSVSCGNGTDALYIAMRALGVRPGD